MSFHQKYAELRRYLKVLASTHASLVDVRANAFPYWFAQAVLIHPDDHESLLRCLVGGPNDKNLDVIAYNDTAKEVYLCQTKCRDALMKSGEKVNDLVAFAKIAGAFTEERRDKFNSHFPRSGFKTAANLNLRPARTCDYKADRKESFDEPPHIRTD